MILLLALTTPSLAADILVYGPLDYTEASVLAADGHTVTEWDASVWSSAIQSDFETFDAIVFGDKDCSGPSTSDFEILYTTRSTWSPAITGNIVVTGTDAGCHSGSSGASPFIQASVDWAASGSGTGLYVSGDWGRRDWDYIDYWGTWGTTTSHYDNAVITDPSHPVFDGVSSISNWGNTAHSYIDTYPTGWDVVATDASGNALVLVFEDCDGDGDGDLATRCGGDDCDDADASIYLGAPETAADGVDQDCDGFDDCYFDTDADGYGGATAAPGSTLDCTGTTETVDDSDCDDSDASVYPGAAETTADGVDQDCDGLDDCYDDADEDGYGTSTVITGSDLSCTGAGESLTNDDCDDADASVYPGATEIAVDGVDQDCDGADDCYYDGDLDGFGSTETLAGADLTCENAGESLTADDCDDASDVTYPGAAPFDDAEACMTDADDDDYGDAAATGDVTPGTDCDDAEATTYPGAPDTWYDGVDSDCAGDNDDDADVDGYGIDEDCDDTDATVYPGADDTWYDGVDSDCGGDDDNDADADGVTVDEDCDDADSTVYPGAEDIADDGIDQDCDGEDTVTPADDVDGGKVEGGGGCSTMPLADLALTPALLGLAAMAGRRRRDD